MSRIQLFIGGFLLLVLIGALLLMGRSNGLQAEEDHPVLAARGGEEGKERPRTAPVGARSSEETAKGSQICGVVISEDTGRPVSSALVALRGPWGSAAARVEDDGGFCFRDLVPGSYDLAARDGDMRSETLEGLLLEAGGEVRDLALVLRGGTWVEGRVLDRRSGEPVVGARVLAHCEAGMGLSTGTSDGDGDFTLTGVPAGRHRLSVSAAGYSMGELLLDVPRRRPVRGVYLILDPLATVSGRVEDESGGPVAGAAVQAVAYKLKDQPEPIMVDGEGSVRSREDGSFEVEAPPGLVTVHASASGHGPGRTTGIEVGPGGAAEGIVVRLTNAAGLVIDVVDTGARPASGARVRAVCDGRVLCGSGVTDAAGRLLLGDLAAGRVQVEATGAGGSGSAHLSVEVSAGVRRHLTVALSEDGLVTGVVVDGRDRAVSGARIIAESDAGEILEQATSDDDGRFHLSVPGGARVALRADAGGRRGELAGVRAGDDVRVVVQPQGAIAGYLAEESGRPVTDFTVSASKAGGEGGPAVWRRQRFASQSGDFLISDLPPGLYRVQACGPGYAAGEEVEVRVWPGEEAGPIGLVVSSAGRIRGRVSNPMGQGVSGARVALEFGRLRGLSRWAGSPGSAVETGPGGEFLLDDVPVGPGRRVYAWHPDWGAAAGAPVTVRADSVAGPVEVRLRPRRGRRAIQPPEAFGGVGMTIREDTEGGVRVADVYPGGPAFLAGLRAGDKLLAVDGMLVDVMGLRRTLQAIRGPVGSDVALLLERASGERFEARMVRVELQM